MENRYNLTLDFKQRTVYNVNFVQNDINTSVLEFTILNNGQPVDLTGQTLTVTFLKPDGTMVMQDQNNGTSLLGNGDVQCILQRNTLAAVGVVKGEVNFTDSNGNKLSTAQFVFNVVSSLSDGTALDSTNQLPKLDSKMVDIQNQYNSDSATWNYEVDVAIAAAGTATDNAVIATTNATNAAASATTAATNANNAVATINNGMLINYKGVVSTYASLPTSNRIVGDTYQVTNDGTPSNNGWWRWSGTAWVQTSAINMSGYEIVSNVQLVDQAKAGIVRNQRHSGCLTIPAFTLGDTTNLNSITIPATTYSINGYEIPMPQTVLTLDAPPATGKREDLVFLEAYFPTSGSGYQLAARYRKVSGVDFSTYGADGFCIVTSSGGAINYNANVTPQGGNASPLINDGTQNYGGPATFNNYAQRSANNYIAPSDVGLYVAGKGDSTSKTTLQTYDGYSYAIPIARVPRRNSGGYSPSNPGGAINYHVFLPSLPCSFAQGTGGNIITLINTTDMSQFYIGEILTKTNDPNWYITVQSINTGAKQITVYVDFLKNGGSATCYLDTSQALCIRSDRPDSLYANVIDPRDIPQPYDLRHRVQPQFNYEYELKRASDQFMRGEIGTKKTMLKTYHGIPKSQTDANTVFYASLDGTTVAEVGGVPTIGGNNVSFVPSITGAGLSSGVYNLNYAGLSDLSVNTVVTIDFAFKRTGNGGGGDSYCFGITNATVNKTFLACLFNSSTKQMQIFINNNTDSTLYSWNVPNMVPVINTQYLFRVTYNTLTKLVTVYRNGAYIGSNTFANTSVVTGSTVLIIGSISSSQQTCGIISDVHISNIDRGSTFYHLPPEFISGDAQIMPAYTNQRGILSEAQMTQTVQGLVTVGNTANGRGLNTSRASGSWASGDTITVTGTAGELVSGVIDIDTALAKVIKTCSNDVTVYLDDVSKIAVNDVFTSFVPTTGAYGGQRTVTAVDSTAKTITINSPATYNIGDLLLEITASSSTPKISFGITGTAQAGASTTITLAATASATDSRYNNLTVYITSGTGAGQSRTISSYVGATKVATVSSAWTTNPDATSVYAIYGVTVNGTWTNLGTNQATFTLATDATLTTQTIEVDYSIIMPAGQPALIAPTTATLAGEAGIRIPSSMSTLAGNDFTGKISGQTWENPNGAYTGSVVVSGNPAPSTFTTELQTSEYANILTQNGTNFSYSTSVNGQQASVLIKLDLIKIVERKLDCKIPGGTVANKVAWLKSNLANITCSWWGYGSSPTGSKANFTLFNLANNQWNSPTYHTNSTVTVRVITLTSGGSTWINIINNIDSNGFIYFLAYADPSDGTTPSVINTDYVSLDITFASKVVNSYKLVNGTLAVRDDFAGKVAGDVSACPNIGKWIMSSTLQNPSAFTFEDNQTIYSNLSLLDGTLWGHSITSNGIIPQALFSFNLIRIVEDKYGPIPALDKVAWLKSNVNSAICNWRGYGSSSTGNKAHFKPWISANNAYSIRPDTEGINSTSNSTVTKITFNLSQTDGYNDTFSRTIDSNGFVYFLAYADPSDGVTASTIYTDYVNIELTFNALTGYDQLVPDNPRRDAGMSNIVRIRKETKEVQTMFPETYDLNLVSYEDYLPAPDPIATNTDVTILAEIPEFLVADLGSAVGYKQGTHQWMNPAYRVGQDNDNLYGELGFSSVPFAPDSVGVNTGSKITVGIGGGAGNLTNVRGLNIAYKPLVLVGKWLVLLNGELKLLIISSYTSNGTTGIGGGLGIIISLTGKPLSKEIDGIVRGGWLNATLWKTNPLVVEGFLDKATNKLITTNNSI